QLRSLTRLRKRPSTSELVDWLAVLQAAGVQNVKLEAQLPFVGALLKKEQDLEAFAEAAGARRGGGGRVRRGPLPAEAAQGSGRGAGGARARPGAGGGPSRQLAGGLL